MSKREKDQFASGAVSAPPPDKDAPNIPDDMAEFLAGLSFEQKDEILLAVINSPLLFDRMYQLMLRNGVIDRTYPDMPKEIRFHNFFLLFKG